MNKGGMAEGVGGAPMPPMKLSFNAKRRCSFAARIPTRQSLLLSRGGKGKNFLESWSIISFTWLPIRGWRGRYVG